MRTVRASLSTACMLALTGCTPDAPQVDVQRVGNTFRATFTQSVFGFGPFRTSPCVTRIEVWQNGLTILAAESVGNPCSKLSSFTYPVAPDQFRTLFGPRPFDSREPLRLVIEAGPKFCYDVENVAAVVKCAANSLALR